MLIFAIIGLAYSSGSSQNSGNFETPFTKYRVSTKTCTKITHFTGSLIFIPDDAFTFSTDNYPDSVNLYFREIHSPLEMIVNNIQMQIDLAGRKYNLESNGMFEVWALWENDTLSLNEDKTIEVRMAMSPEKLNLAMEGFIYDNSSASWDSYNQLNANTVNSFDDEFWGSSAISNDPIMIEEGELLLTKEDSIRKIVFQAMAIYEFGLFNYDMLIAGETFVKVKANFSYKQTPLKSTIYVVYDDLNSVFNYAVNQWETEFALIQDRKYKLFTINEKGQVFSLSKFPILDEIGDDIYEFALISDESIPVNLAELSKLTGIQ